MISSIVIGYLLFNWYVNASTIITSMTDREIYLSEGIVWFPETESLISNRDLFNGPPNPYNLTTHQTLDCDFVEPDPLNPIGGTTPKFYCEFSLNGKKVQAKIKYDQQYNSVHTSWGPPNEEVYANVVGQRILWALGFGTDQSVSISVNCRNCPIEPWTYIQAIQGYNYDDILTGWMDMKLIETNQWSKKVPIVNFKSAIVFFKLDNYISGDEIDYIDSKGRQESGFNWHELYEYPANDTIQMVARDALSVVAAFLSYSDNHDSNQGFMCMDKYPSSNLLTSSFLSSKSTICKGTPLLYIHDIGGSLGFGWERRKNLRPNYFDLPPWFNLSTWGSISKCEVQVHGPPNSSWTGNLPVSEDGRQLASTLFAQLTHKQINDTFTSARANLMRNDSIIDWVNGFIAKMTRDIFDTSCPSLTTQKKLLS